MELISKAFFIEVNYNSTKGISLESPNIRKDGHN